MSYNLVPYVHAAGKTAGGLGQAEPVPSPASATQTTDPLWARLVAAFGTPVVGALSSRIAYGKTWAPYPGSFYGGAQTPGGYYGGTGYISPQTLLLLGGAAILVIALSK